jgi:hypothetical protein
VTSWSIEIIPQSPFGNTSRSVVPQDDLSEMSSHFDTEFPVPNFLGIGSARILSDRPIAANAAVYNGMGGTRGDFGYAMKGTGIEDAREAGVLIDLTTSSPEDLLAGVGHRTNVGYLNPQFHDVVATFSAVGGNGVVLGSKVVQIPAGAMAQLPLFDLIDTVTGPARVGDGIWVEWTADAPLFVYATVVNNHTGDAEVRD